MFTRASAAIDRASMRFLERRMTSGSPGIETGDGRAQMIALARAYSDGTLGVPSPFFPIPNMPVPTLRPIEGTPDTRVVDLSWLSEYRPFHPEARTPYLAAHENMTAHVRWWTRD